MRASIQTLRLLCQIKSVKVFREVIGFHSDKSKYIVWAKRIEQVAEAAATQSYHCDVRSYRRVSRLWLTVLGKISCEWRYVSVVTYYILYINFSNFWSLRNEKKTEKKNTYLT